MLAVLLPSACRPAASALAWWPALADAVRQRLEGHARLAGIVQARLDSGETAATWSLDLEGGLRLDRRSRLFLLLEAAQGPGLSGDLAEAFFGVNAEAGPPHARLGLTELWYMWQEGRFALTAGKLDLTRFFDTNAVANDPLLQFLAPGLVNAPGVAFPDPGPGLRLQWRPAAGAEVAAAWAAADVAGLVASPFVILELGLRPCGHWLQGHCRLYGWYGGETDGPPSGLPWGVGLSYDRPLWSPVTAFVRWAYQHQAVAMSWSAGVQVAGTPWQRPTDTAALAVGQAVPHGELPATAPETVVEAYYRLGFGPHLGLSVHLQVLAHPGGDASRQPALVAGMRLLLAR